MPARDRQTIIKPGQPLAAGLLLSLILLAGTIPWCSALAAEGHRDMAVAFPDTEKAMPADKDATMLDFFTFSRPSKPNNYLACTDEHCPKAGYDVTAPVYEAPLAQIVEAWDALIADQSRLEETGRSSDGWQREYVQRTRFLRFPDIITVRFVAEDVEEGALPKTRVLVHSQAKYGYYDFGVNKQRVMGWLADLEQRLLLK